MVNHKTGRKSKKPIMLPNLLLFGLLRRPKNSADIIHRAYTIYFWRHCRSLRSRLSVLKAFVISPLYIIRDIRKWAGKMGAGAASCSNKSRLRQRLEQFYLAFFFSIDSNNYYLQEFYLPDGLTRARYFVNKGAIKYGVYRLLSSYGKRIYSYSNDFSLGEKTLFSHFCREKGIPVVPVLMKFMADGTIYDYRYNDKAKEELPQQNIFCKPNIDKEGEGAEAWFWKGNGEYEDLNGRRLDYLGLRRWLIELAGKHFSGAYIVQPLILPHPDLALFRKKATPTIRIITYVDTDGEIKVDRAMLRFSRNPSAIVDNASAGGMVAPVDAATGELGPATEAGPACIKNRWNTLQDNKAQIKDLSLPYWKEACDLVLRMYQYFPHRLIIGWDILIVSSGSVILEGNSQPGLCFLQKAHLIPLGKMDLGNALAVHSQKAVKYLYSGIVGNDNKNKESVDLYGGSVWQRWLGWLRIDRRKAVHLTISGKVQGVFYRKWMSKKAGIHRICGWVRNSPDGDVVAVLRGKAIDIEDLVNECWLGPNETRVDSIKAKWHKKPVEKGFKILRGKIPE